MASDIDELKKEIPHVIVLLALLLVLLIVLTKFKVVHCSQVPGNWCATYCSYFNGGKSRVALISGTTGIGDPNLLRNTISQQRLFTFIEPVPMQGMSAGLLKSYELVILERAKKITPYQAQALQEYVAQGGALMIVGDSATEYYVSADDLAAAELENQTNPGAIDRLQNRAKQSGFGILSAEIQAKYVRTENASKGVSFKRVLRDHLVMSGLKDEFDLPTLPFVVVAPQQAMTTIVAVLKTKDGKEYPAMLDTKIGLRTAVFYVSFPLESSGSKTLLLNAMDYLVTC